MDKTEFTRRQFVGRTGAGLLAAAMLGGAGEKSIHAATDRRPNILFIVSDEHNPRIMGCQGNKLVHTPNMDSLAQNGVLFENCYCNSPLCVPSRLAITSGKYISRVGAWSNECWLPSDDYPSLPRVLSAAGYEPYLCGKMHYDATRRYGFTEVGGNMNAHYKTGKCRRRKADDLTPHPGYSNRFNDFHTGDTSSVLEHDRRVTKGSIEFLKNRKREDPPFLLLSGYLAPHFPIIVPQRYFDEYRGKVPMPVIPDGFLDSMPLNYKHLRIGFNIEDAPEDLVRKGRELYYGFVQWVDNEIGKVLRTLADSDVADNTVVIYTSDHGENMGEHGLWWKNCMYESAAHVPLIVSYPPLWNGGQRRTQVCSLVDVVQTIAEICGGKTPDDWNGHSMVPVLENGHAQWKNAALSQYYAHNIASGFTMYREGAYKYVYHTRPDETHPPQRELYNLDEDPGEFHNLAGKPEHAERVAHMHAALVAEIGENPDDTEQRCRADYAKGYGRPKKAGARHHAAAV